MKLSNRQVRRSLLLTLALALIIGLLVSMLSLHHSSKQSVSRSEVIPPTLSQAQETYGRIPLSFEANQGQTDSSVNFLARGAGYALFLKPSEAVFVLKRDSGGVRAQNTTEQSSAELMIPTSRSKHDDASDDTSDAPPKVLRMKLVGADASASVSGADELPGKVNYLIGSDSRLWRTDVPTYARVLYRDVYQGVDIVYYGNQRQLEYDFVVAPGRDPRTITLQFDGADKVEVDAAGDLLLTLGERVVRQPKPVVYQDVAGARLTVEGGYAIGADGHVGFASASTTHGCRSSLIRLWSTQLTSAAAILTKATTSEWTPPAVLISAVSRTRPTSHSQCLPRHVQCSHRQLSRARRLRHETQPGGHSPRLLDLPRRQQRRQV